MYDCCAAGVGCASAVADCAGMAVGVAVEVDPAVAVAVVE